jgi:hypothetical protein
LYHIDISPATTRAADTKNRGILGAYPPIPMYSCLLIARTGLNRGNDKKRA